MTNSLQQLSPQVAALQAKLETFVQDQCEPAEKEYEEHMKNRVGGDRWSLDAVPPCMERLKRGEVVLTVI